MVRSKCLSRNSLKNGECVWIIIFLYIMLDEFYCLMGITYLHQFLLYVYVLVNNGNFGVCLYIKRVSEWYFSQGQFKENILLCLGV